ncbi:MAG: maltose ABC transporter periplasmic protein [Parcubacteria bacterium OLB19]|nr:MAG: maltose ABC transporter periplasmic protein [Parcubacteria bacterium OLB19]
MKLRPFELGLIVLFALLFLVALVLLRTYEPKADPNAVDLNVTIWGTLPADTFEQVLNEVGDQDSAYRLVSYRYVDPNDFDETFLNALADQKPPDVVLMPHEKLVEHRSRLQAIPYESFPERDFRSKYIDGASIFTMRDGVYAFPLMVDPLVMYWNRDVFSDKNFLTPPKTWEEIVTVLAPTITVRDFNRSVQLSTMAMGEYENIKNAFPILSMLLLQAGSNFVTEDENNQYEILIDDTSEGVSARPLEKVLGFYTGFSNVNNSLYNWNRTLGLDQDRFLSEDLAIYFGYGSEGRGFETKNPNLSFDIAEVPQGSGVTNKRTYGTFYGFFVPKTANNKPGALRVIQTLTQDQYVKRFADSYNMAPLQRNLIAVGSNDVYGRIIYQSAPNSRGWLNPDLDRLSELLQDEIDDVNSNRDSVDNTADDIATRLKQIY